MPLLLAWARRGRQRRTQRMLLLGQQDRLTPRDHTALWLAAIILLLLALAQPRWGRIFPPSQVSGHELVLVMDVSRSMAAQDAVPDRLGAAVQSALSLLVAAGRS